MTALDSGSFDVQGHGYGMTIDITNYWYATCSLFRAWWEVWATVVSLLSLEWCRPLVLQPWVVPWAGACSHDPYYHLLSALEVNLEGWKQVLTPKGWTCRPHSVG
jgi:hypothetical protein